MKSFSGLFISYIFGYLLSIKKIFYLKYKNIVFNYKSSGKCKGKILIASNTTSALHITNLELYFAKILYKNNYDVTFYLSDGLNCFSLLQHERGEKFNLSLNDLIRIENLSCNFLSWIINFLGSKEKIKYKFWKDISSRKNKYVESFIEDFKNNLENKFFEKCEVHEHTISNLARYLGRSCSYEEIFNNNYLKETYCKILKSACITVLDWKEILSHNKPELLLVNHGLYIPQGVILEVAKLTNIKVKTFHPGYRKRTVITGSGDTYHKTLVNKNIENLLKVKLTKNKKAQIKSYLHSRRYGFNDQISFAHKKAETNPLPNSLIGLKDFALVLTNVEWDAQGNYKENVYDSMNEWLIQIIELAKRHKDIKFVFRCHPAEVTGRRVSAIRTANFIEKNATGLQNIIIIKSEDQVSTYKLIEKSKSVIVYSTKTSIEAACLGKSVLVCGESFIRGKKIGIDLKHKRDLEKMFLKSFYEHKVNKERSLRYAYYFFFHEMIDLPRISDDNTKKGEIKFIKKLLEI